MTVLRGYEANFVLPNLLTDLGAKCPHNLSQFPPSFKHFEKNIRRL